MKKIALLCTALCLGCMSLAGAEPGKTFPDKVYSSFMEYYKRGVPEKLYVQTDKPFYSSGEDIWFKGFLVNGVTGEPADYSKFIYVEIADRFGGVVMRQKIKADKWGFDGKFSLKPDFPFGQYALRAYTKWMSNESSDFFFEKKINIGNIIDDRMNIGISYTMGADSMVSALLRITDASFKPMAAKEVYYLLNFKPGDDIKTFRGRTNVNGELVVKFDPKGTTDKSFLEVRDSDDDGGYRRRFAIPEFSKNFDMQFFPEGGTLLAGGMQKVAFKAVAATGLGEEVTGKVYNMDGEIVTELGESHNGMGRFEIFAEEGGEYYAEVTGKSGMTKRVVLPPVKKTGCVVNAATVRDRILYTVRYSPDLNPASMYVVIQSRGRLMKVEAVNPAKPARMIRANSLPAGITSIALIDKEGNMLSERLLFVKNDSLPRIGVSTNKSDYYRRELVEMEIKVKDKNGMPVAGNFGLSVTDGRSVPFDTVSNTIVSYLLLSSDIKGYVEDPAYYFSSDSPEVNRDLDVLMMTQGWKRFNITDVVKRNITPYLYPHEEAYSITGNVTGFFGNAAKRPNLIVFIPQSKYLNMFSLNDTNKFSLDGMDVPDSTTIIVQAVGRNGGKGLNLNIDSQAYPLKQSRFARNYVPNAIPVEYLNQIKEKYYYEGGMKVINMDAVTVTAQRIEDVPVMYNAVPDHRLVGEKLARFENTDIYTALSTFPGVRIMGGGGGIDDKQIMIRGSRDEPLVYIDDMQAEVTDLATLNMQEVARIDIVTGADAGMFGLGASGGVILINLKAGAEYQGLVSPPSFAKITPLGYSKPVEFYVPRYDLPEKREDKTPDLRTTIYWDPHVATDSTGVTKVRFYTADRSTVYNVVIEGVSTGGDPCRYQGTIARRRD